MPSVTNSVRSAPKRVQEMLHHGLNHMAHSAQQQQQEQQHVVLSSAPLVYTAGHSIVHPAAATLRVYTSYWYEANMRTVVSYSHQRHTFRPRTRGQSFSSIFSSVAAVILICYAYSYLVITYSWSTDIRVLLPRIMRPILRGS